MILSACSRWFAARSLGLAFGQAVYWVRCLVSRGAPCLKVGLVLIWASAGNGVWRSEAAEHYVSPEGGNVAPFSDWATAATNIQEALDAAAAQDTVWVTNGIYGWGGRTANGGTVTNRVVIDKALTLQSVNGAEVTIIQGAWDPATNGPLAVRCVSIANGAVLRGFTLRGGGTQPHASRSSPDQLGGGILGVSTNCLVADCVLVGNAAGSSGGGASQTTLSNCTFTGNIAVGVPQAGSAGQGGGAVNSLLLNCRLTGNWAQYSGGGAYSSTLRNCAVTGNRSVAYGAGVDNCKAVNSTITLNFCGSDISGEGAGAFRSSLTNCIVYQNRLYRPSGSTSNYSLGTMAWCCSAPLAPGTGNISADPQLLSDGIHLDSASPCLGQGSPLFTAGNDLDGQEWSNAPAMGCDEWWPAPVVVGAPTVQAGGAPARLSVSASAIAGEGAFDLSWAKNGALLEDDGHWSGTHSPELSATGFGPAEAGVYQVIASNAWGMSTSAPVRITIHCVNAAAMAASAPYADWISAAPQIQDAVDASETGDFVVVTNGTYNTGGRVMSGDLTNRVAITKAIQVLSVNGPESTVIEGAWDPVTTNGPLAVRCVWLADGASLSGFTITNGATRSLSNDLGFGGGVFGLSTNGLVVDCVLSGNSAANSGGGIYRGTAKSSRLLGNVATTGGGAAGGLLTGCAIYDNRARSYGGAAANCTLVNCTVTYNAAPTTAGIRSCSAYNSIVYWNAFYSGFSDNSALSTFTNSCTTPAPPGAMNIGADPQLTDRFHLATTSPCLGKGDGQFAASEHDIDGESWATPPAMGCDEVHEGSITGELSVALSAPMPEVVIGHNNYFTALVSGRASRFAWDFGDGTILTNTSSLGAYHAWTNTGGFKVTFTAYNADHPEGVSTNVEISVLPLEAPLLANSGLAGTNFSVSFVSQAGVFYTLEQTTDLAPPVIWNSVRSAYGNGDILQMTDTQATNAARFYRLRVE